MGNVKRHQKKWALFLRELWGYVCVTSLYNQLQESKWEGEEKGEDKGREAMWGEEVEGSRGQNPERAGQSDAEAEKESENHTIYRGLRNELDLLLHFEWKYTGAQRN